MRLRDVTAHAACVVILAAAALGATGCSQSTRCNNGLGEGGGGAGGAGEGSAGLGEGGSPTPAPSAVRIGFGSYAGPCDNQSTYAERAQVPDQLGSIASQAVFFEFPGTVVRASVVHVISEWQTVCDAAERAVLVSEPTFDEVPSSPGLHETMHWGSKEIVDAPNYDMPDAEYGALKVLGRELAQPFHVKKQQRVFLGSLLQTGTECVVGCGGFLPDGSEAPSGDTFCTDAEAWKGCGPEGGPGGDNLAYVGWLDVIPDEP